MDLWLGLELKTRFVEEVPPDVPRPAEERCSGGRYADHRLGRQGGPGAPGRRLARSKDPSGASRSSKETTSKEIRELPRRRLAAATMETPRSMAVTASPFAASCSVSWPVPQPTSRTALPGLSPGGLDDEPDDLGAGTAPGGLV